MSGGAPGGHQDAGGGSPLAAVPVAGSLVTVDLAFARHPVRLELRVAG